MPTIRKGGGIPAPPQPSAATRSLAQVLNEVAERNRTLDELDSRLSASIARIEAMLSTHFSVRLALAISESEHGELTGNSLVWGKHDGKWQLIIETDRGNWDPTTTPLLSASREWRSRVFSEGHLEALIRNAVSYLDTQISARHAALANADAVVEALDGMDIPF